MTTRKLIRIILSTLPALGGVGAVEDPGFAPIIPPRSEATSWAEWRETASGSEVSSSGAEFMAHQQHGAPHSIQKSLNGHIYRFEIRPGEGRDSDRARKNDRAELQSRRRFPVGEDLWIAYSLKIEDHPGFGEHRRVVINQIHDGGGRSPVMSFRLNQGRFRVQTITDTARDPETKRPLVTEQFESAINFNEWYNVVIRARIGTRKNAILQVWLNGTQILDLKEFDMGHVNEPSVFWKFGVYRDTHPGTHALQFANLELILISFQDESKNDTCLACQDHAESILSQ